MKREVLGIALAVSIAAGGAGETSTPQGELDLRQTSLTATQETFQAAHDYWAKKDIGLAAIKLEIVGPGETFDCAYEYRTATLTEKSPTVFCPSSETIVIPTGSMVDVTGALPGYSADKARLNVLHEYGHAVAMKQSGMNATEYINDWWDDTTRNELLATENAGRMAANVLNMYGRIGIEHYLSANPRQSDEDHGTVANHIDAFEAGVAQQDSL